MLNSDQGNKSSLFDRKFATITRTEEFDGRERCLSTNALTVSLQ